VAARRPQAGIPQQVNLSQAIAIAAATSPVLASARAALAQAQAPLSLAKTAILPNVSAVASTTRSNGSSSIGGRNFGSGGYTSRGLTASLRQLIYDGGRVAAQIHEARSTYHSATGTFERQYQTLADTVATAYYNALQAGAARALAERVVQQNEVQERLVSAQMHAGTASRVDVLTAQVPLAQARVALVRAQGTELEAFAAFANALGLNADTLVRPAGGATAAVTSILRGQPLTYEAAVQRALLDRPAVLAAQQSVAAEQYNVRYQSLGLFPSLNGTAGYGTSSTTPTGTDFRPSNSIGFSLTIPLYDQGVTHAQTALARAQLAQAQAQLQNTELTVQLNVEQSLVNYITAQAALTQTQAELANAATVLSATQAQYKAGVTTLPLLLNAEVGLTTAQNDRLTAQYGLRQAEEAYLYALGENAP
jgi:outer membrane protein TolC